MDPSDPRSLVELPEWVPADASGLYRVPALDRRSIEPNGVRTNPLEAARSILQRLRGTRPSAETLADATAAAATERSLPVRELDRRGRTGADRDQSSTAWRRNWTVGAWAVTAVTAGIPLAAIGLLVVASGLLAWILAALLVVGALALGTGFALLHEAAAIRRTDASFAAVIAEASFDAGDGAHPVVVVPARNAAGVAAVLRERGIAAEARGPDVAPGTGT
ncbi:hypothetical protein GCM10028857_15710 [Salinarchaeum chitinilyticum]